MVMYPGVQPKEMDRVQHWYHENNRKSKIFHDMVETWNTYWGSIGRYQYQIWGESNWHSQRYYAIMCEKQIELLYAKRVNHKEEHSEVYHCGSAF